METVIIDGQISALNNSLIYHKMIGYTIHKYHQDDKRKVKQLYFLTDNKGNSLTGHWDYLEMDCFIRGYGKCRIEYDKLKEQRDILLEALKNSYDMLVTLHNRGEDFDSKPLNMTLHNDKKLWDSYLNVQVTNEKLINLSL